MFGKGYHKLYKRHPYYPAYKKYGMIDQLGRSFETVSSDEVKKFLYEKLQADVQTGEKKDMPRREYIGLLPF